MAVTSKLNRKGLSALVNHMLSGESDGEDSSDDEDETNSDSTPSNHSFDFAIDDKLLRMSLGGFIKKYNISRESSLKLVYFFREKKPEPSSSQPHDDWVSAVAGNWKGLFLSGSYDQKLRLVEAETGENLLEFQGHDQAIKSVCWGLQNESVMNVFSGSDDFSIKSWNINLDQGNASLVSVFNGHKGSVEDLAYNFQSQKLVSASWDSTLAIWDTSPKGRYANGQEGDSDNEEDEEDQDSSNSNNKRKKKGANKATPKRRKVVVEPVRTLEGHQSSVSSVVWPSKDKIISGSWDHTIHFWDAESGTPTNVMTSNSVVRGLTYSQESSLVISAHSDNCIRLWDERSSSKQINKVINNAHGKWVNRVCFEQSAGKTQTSTLFASVSHDSTARIWDVRSLNKPLHTIKTPGKEGNKEKMLCVDLWSDWLAVGGTDRELRLLRRNQLETK
eukprot:TRINITY_DN6547_c0_g1_i1.p1 TRINITY_DN6547_c0_g1~~TRINITY_DN6547_c0_g1_i1.p1  ORF type:complete len:480 (+),score=174.81 TRINITY_DN6547_c0_g1_i1:104-1441(+)